MTWRHWLGIVAGAGVGIALAVILHKCSEYSDPTVLETTGEVSY